MTLSLTCDENWKTLLRCLPEDYEALACKHKQVQTQYGNAKIRDAGTLLRFIFLHAGADLPLRQTVAVIAEAGGPSLSPMRLHKKMARAAPYLRALVERMVEWPSLGARELWGGYMLTAVDATVICGPGAIGTDARIHTKLCVADVSITAVEVTDATGGETFRLLPRRDGSPREGPEGGGGGFREGRRGGRAQEGPRPGRREERRARDGGGGDEVAEAAHFHRVAQRSSAGSRASGTTRGVLAPVSSASAKTWPAMTSTMHREIGAAPRTTSVARPAPTSSIVAVPVEWYEAHTLAAFLMT